ncbi:MAG: hypothetical protein QNJ68_13580 [Microcoleaceae cyanobacterium MO_207.B10]|nr:hypothetical protein [Microcoleaceae cyanobacterium MO_207.B10]
MLVFLQKFFSIEQIAQTLDVDVEAIINVANLSNFEEDNLFFYVAIAIVQQ